MGNAFGHWIDLSGMSFDDGGTWIQALPLGTYEHPVYGTIDITPLRVQRFAQNVQARVRGQDLDIDYDHKADTRIAAGWVADAQARMDGLWLKVDWTPAARQALKDKEYRYFSPEFDDVWTHPKTGVTYQDVLFGGALTNRPFLKDILPINLSEMVGDHNMGDTKTGAGGTPPTDADNMVGMAKLFGLSGPVTSADILAAAAAKLSEPNQQHQHPQQVVQVPSQVPNVVLNVPVPQAPAPAQAQPQTVQLADGKQYQLVPVAPAPAPAPTVQPTVPAGQGVGGAGQGAGGQINLGNILAPVQLDDSLRGDPVALADVVRAQNEKIGLLASAHKLAEAQAFIAQLNEGNGSIGLSPVVRDLALELMVKAPVALGETVQKLLHTVAEGRATVALGELGRSRTAGGGAIQEFEKAITKLREGAGDKGMSYADAVDELSRTNPRLANEYREATMAGEE